VVCSSDMPRRVLTCTGCVQREVSHRRYHCRVLSEHPVLGMNGDGPVALFTYVGTSDRALMELALQVVGLRMTGRLEAAHQIAMRIVGDDEQPNG
ncbi:hypothetical protein THASP1DRAFT_4896, partial [Thamnocephalis sphaerospora]